MPIKLPERKPPREERDKPIPWSQRATNILVDMSATRGANRKDLRDDKHIDKQRFETFKTPSGTMTATSQYTKSPISYRRAKRRAANRIAKAARKRNR